MRPSLGLIPILSDHWPVKQFSSVFWLLKCISKDSYIQQGKWKLYGVGPIDSRPSTNGLHQFRRRRKEKAKRRICDTWHLTCDMWHQTFDMWHVTHGGGWTLSQNVSSLALTVWDLWCLEDWVEKDQLLTRVIVELPQRHPVC